MSNLISLNEAIVLLRAGSNVEPEKVDLQSGSISSVDALYLFRNGIKVSEDQIYYDDDKIAYDPEFDDVEWGEPYPAKSKISLDLSVPSPVKEWIDSKKINIEELIRNLLISQMNSDQLINNNK